MGHSSSSSRLREGLLVSPQDKSMGNSCAVAGRTKEVFKWKIDGFSSLLNLEAESHDSDEFEACGYKWKLRMYPKKAYISLSLCLADPSSVQSGMAIKTLCKLIIYDQIHGKNHTKKGNCYYHTTDTIWGFSELMISKTLKMPASGFLVNDSCIFGVEFIEAHAYMLKCQDVSQCLSLKKEIVSGTFTWKIDNFSKLQRPRVSSRAFLVGGLKWHIDLYPEGLNTNDHLSAYLVLEDSLKEGTYVEYSLYMKDQINTKHKKQTARSYFDSKHPSYGFMKLISLIDFCNPLKGFLKESTCVIEVSLAILGSVYAP